MYTNSGPGAQRQVKTVRLVGWRLCISSHMLGYLEAKLDHAYGGWKMMMVVMCMSTPSRSVAPIRLYTW